MREILSISGMNASTIWSIALWMDIGRNPWRRRTPLPPPAPGLHGEVPAVAQRQLARGNLVRAAHACAGHTLGGPMRQGATFAAPRRWYHCDAAAYASQGN